MKSTPLVSVVLPVHNAEAYLREAVDSILDQTFKDFELVVVNDGSTDSSGDIIASYSDSRIVYIENGKCLKLPATLNKGIAAAKGRYIARMDADDRSLPHRLERQVAFLESHRDVDLCGSWAHLIDGEGNRYSRLKNATDAEALKCLLLFTCPLVHPSVMGRAEVFRRHPYSEASLHAEDFALWTEMAREGIRMANIGEYLFEYRWHNANVSLINSEIQIQAKASIIRPALAALLGHEPDSNEIKLHLLSFSLYNKGRRSDSRPDEGSLAAERAYLAELAEAALRTGLYGSNYFDGLVLSRWIVCCIAMGKWSGIFSMPSRLYRPSSALKAFKYLIQK